MYTVFGPDEAVYGPVDFAGLKRWALEGRLTGSMLVEETKTGRRVRAEEIQGLFSNATNYAEPPQNTFQVPAANYPRAAVETMPPNHLVKSILATCFCCLPVGIVAIVYAAQVSSQYNVGDYEGARRSSALANTWGNWSIGLAVIPVVFGVLMQAAILHTIFSGPGFPPR